MRGIIQRFRRLAHRSSGRAVQSAGRCLGTILPVATLFALLALAVAAPSARGAANLSLVDDMVLDEDAALMPNSAPYGRAINGVSFQTEALLTYNGYQYATWYHSSDGRGGSDEDVYLARRNLDGTGWEIFDTGGNLDNGDASAWDAHNVISIGVSGDGRIHMAWDMHNHTLRYRETDAGVATSPGGTWDSSIIGDERNSLDPGGASIQEVTYVRFIPKPGGDLVMTYRVPGGGGGGSGNGLIYLSTYDATTGNWDTPHQILANTGFYSDPVGNSTTRNAYLNGLDIGPDGAYHITWTWRESAGGANHEIMYAYSKDGGDTWLNNDGGVVGSVGNPITIDSPGINIATMDRRQTLMNQQGQAVDLDGGVHALMWHRRFDEAGFQWQSGDPTFYTNDAAYYHYYRDPGTGDWSRNQLPVSENVGSRPKIGYDADGNLFAVYTSPDVIPSQSGGIYADGNLVIAGATKAANYTDWTILAMDERVFSGEPFLDQDRLLNEGILSVFIQETGPNSTSRIGTPLHVLEYEIQFGIPGDFNKDGLVDAADYVMWRMGLGTEYSEDDYDDWRDHFGETDGGNGSRSASAVPEPATVIQLIVGAAASCCGWWRRRRKP